MGQRIAHAKNDVERLLNLRAKRGDIRMDRRDGQAERTRPKLIEQRLTTINGGDGVAALRERQCVQAEAGSEVKCSSAARLGQMQGVELRCALRQGCVDITHHPGIDAPRMSFVVLLTRRHVTPRIARRSQAAPAAAAAAYAPQA